MTGAGLPKRILRRLLHQLGLATAGDVERARRDAMSRARTDARAQRDRERSSAAAALQAAQNATREQEIANHAERTTLRKALAFHWERLNQLETLFGGHAERLRLQLGAAVAARPAEAASAIGDSSPVDDARRLELGGIAWRLPAAGESGQSAKPSVERCLPLDELAVTRQYVVGGVMLDIGAGFGQTSIPRALLRDFDRIYAAEGRDAWYRCLVANVASCRVSGVVVPDRLAEGFDLDAWLARLQVPLADVRFVRVGAPWTGLEILSAGVRLLPRRDVVWQLDLDPASPVMTLEGFAPLAAVIRKHFTHFKELGRQPAEPWRRAVEAKRLFKREDGPAPSGLLLFNLD